MDRKNCAWITKYEKLSEMCIVQLVEMKSVFTFQPLKRLVSTTVKGAKPAVTFWIFLLGTKNRQLCCLAVMEHIASQETRVATTKKKNHLHFWRNFSTNHNQAHPNLFQKRLKRVQIWNKRMRFQLADDLSHIFIFQIILFNFNLLFAYIQTTQNNQDLLSLQERNPLDSRFWTRLCYDCSKWSRPKYNNQLTRNTTSSLAIALVSKTGLFEQSSSASSNYSQPGGKNGDERSTLQCGAQDLDTSSYQVSDLEDIEFNWENSQLDMYSVFRPGIDTPYSPTVFAGLLMGEGSVENPIGLDEEQDKEIAPPTTPVSERPTEPPRLQRSRPFGARIENVPDYVYRNLFQKVLPCMFVLIKFINNVFHFIKTFFQKLVRHVWG